MSQPMHDGAASGGYTDLRVIGKGSFGTATLVRDNGGRLCVKKNVDVASLDRQQQKAAAAEVMVLASLKHPYVIRYYRSFVSKSSLAIVMEYAEGGDLHKRITETKQANKAFAEHQIRRWIAQVVLGLKYVHNRNILHRDLKPHNLFLTTQDHVRIGDFGIAKVLGTTTVTENKRIGSPAYMAPEVCTDAIYSFASDMWALGCVLYELCALQVAFDGANPMELIKRITRCPAPAVPSEYSMEVRRLCAELLSRDRGMRPSAFDVIQGRIVQGEITQMLLEEHEVRTGDGNGCGTNLAQRAGSSSDISTRPPTRSRCPTPVQGVKDQRPADATEKVQRRMPSLVSRVSTPMQAMKEEGLGATEPPDAIKRKQPATLLDVGERWPRVGSRLSPIGSSHCEQRKSGARGALCHSGSAALLMRRSPKNRGPSPKSKRGCGMLRSASALCDLR